MGSAKLELVWLEGQRLERVQPALTFKARHVFIDLARAAVRKYLHY